MQGGERFNRDIGQDLERLKSHFHACVVVSLNEEHEFTALQIPDILIRVQGLGMESVFYPVCTKRGEAGGEGAGEENKNERREQ